MARPRTFEPEEALNAAMMVFWEKGFSETSYDDLVSATNVSRKGLYTVFGDKEALFLAALKNYCRKMIPEMFGVLQHHDMTVPELIQMFQALTGRVADGELAKGCFMANTAADEIITKPEVKAAYDQFLKTMISEFDGAFRRAGIEEAEAHRLAIYYNGVIQSLQLMAHSRTDPEIVHGFMDTALNELRKCAP
jgi:TetR/AcrR family transcriptional repressor of nem operon